MTIDMLNTMVACGAIKIIEETFNKDLSIEY